MSSNYDITADDMAFMTPDIITAANSTLVAEQARLHQLGFTTRGLKGRVQVYLEQTGDLLFEFLFTEHTRNGTVAAGKVRRLLRGDGESSGQASTLSAAIMASDNKWEGAVRGQGIVVVFSGAEANNDAHFARIYWSFLILVKDSLRPIIEHADPATDTYGGTIGANDIVAHVLLHRLPPAMRALVPFKVEEPAEQIRTAINELVAS